MQNETISNNDRKIKTLASNFGVSEISIISWCLINQINVYALTSAFDVYVKVFPYSDTSKLDDIFDYAEGKGISLFDEYDLCKTTICRVESSCLERLDASEEKSCVQLKLAYELRDDELRFVGVFNDKGDIPTLDECQLVLNGADVAKLNNHFCNKAPSVLKTDDASKNDALPTKTSKYNERVNELEEWLNRMNVDIDAKNYEQILTELKNFYPSSNLWKISSITFRTEFMQKYNKTPKRGGRPSGKS